MFQYLIKELKSAWRDLELVNQRLEEKPDDKGLMKCKEQALEFKAKIKARIMKGEGSHCGGCQSYKMINGVDDDIVGKCRGDLVLHNNEPCKAFVLNSIDVKNFIEKAA